MFFYLSDGIRIVFFKHAECSAYVNKVVYASLMLVHALDASVGMDEIEWLSGKVPYIV